MTVQPQSSRARLVPVLAFLAVAGLFAVALRSGDPSKIPSALIGKQIPRGSFAAVEGLLADGKAVPGFSGADLSKGEVSVVNFWASWCAPCADEHPLITDLKARASVEVYGVNYKDDPGAARRFLGRYGNPFAAVGADPGGSVALDWGVYGMPETFVVDGKGAIVYKHVGAITAEAIATKFLPAIEAARTAADSK